MRKLTKSMKRIIAAALPLNPAQDFPSPNPLPWGEGNRIGTLCRVRGAKARNLFRGILSLEKRVEVRADVYPG